MRHFAAPAAALILLSAPASAAPLALQVSASGGYLTDGTIGVVRDDAQLTLRLGIGLGRYVAAQLGFDFDLERLELGARAGVMARPWAGGRWAPYLRAEVALVGVNYLGVNWELTGGAGGWVRLHRWAALFLEIDAVGRFDMPRSLAEHFVAGVALTAPSFWR